MKSWKLLGYLGLLPFVLCLYLSKEVVFLGVSTQAAFIAYGAIILSFIAGTVWHKNGVASDSMQLLVSNIFSLIAFVTLLIRTDIALLILAPTYILIFLYEKYLSKRQQFPASYMNMRAKLTGCVVFLHITAYFLWFA